MDLLTSIVADAANKAEGDKLNILGVFHIVHAPRVPYAMPHLALALEFKAQPFERGKTFKIDISLLDPDNRKLFAMEANLEIMRHHPELTPIMPLAINLNNVTFPVSGNYRFEIKIEGTRKGEVQLEVKIPPVKKNNE